MLKINFNHLKEYFKIAFKSLTTRKVRSWLTTIGIAIGVFLIVSLLSLSEGLKGAVLNQLGKLGKDLITIIPGDISNISATIFGGGKLSEDDVKIIKKTKGVDVVVIMNHAAITARYKNVKKTVLMYGNDWKNAMDVYKNDMGWSINSGRWPVAGKNEVIIGSIAAKEIFPEIKAGSELVINGRKFRVAGILNSLGSKDDDSMIGIDLDIFKLITGEREGAEMVLVKTKAGYLADNVVDNLKRGLEDNRKRRIGEEKSDSSYTILTSEKITDIVGNIMGVIQAVIIGFASIAIVVGGIGIMNTMYTSVNERVKEIGVLKAIGAKRSTIILIFLIESGIFGMLGGIGGTLLGMVFAKTIETYFQFHPIFYLKADVGIGLILFSISFSFLIGCASGYFPAKAAAKLNPVDALRYE
ncbi:MAG: ABC transporter permease [Candidatus Staskawiczbacteria bacterium]|nr:ABC transporter permease [Candidatus Staskawiczbacteria bacterium]